MSDFTATTPETEAPAEVTTEVGGGEAPAPWAEFDQYADRYVPVKVQGQDNLVPLAEMRNGYMRQQDYTLKTQELAAQRQELERAAAIAEALDTNPAEAIEIISQAYGLTQAEATAAVESAEPQSELERRLAAIEATFQEQQQAQRISELQASLNTVTEKYGVEAQAVVAEATRIGTIDFDAVAKAIAYEKLAAQQAAQAQAEAERNEKVAGARAAQVVHGGSNVNPSAAQTPVGGYDDWDSAAKAALSAHGM